MLFFSFDAYIQYHSIWLHRSFFNVFMLKRLLIFLFLTIFLWGAAFYLYTSQPKSLSSSTLAPTVSYSQCAVSYVYTKISEETITPVIPTPEPSSFPEDSWIPTVSTLPNLDTIPTNKIEDSVDIDFTFSDPTLESEFIRYSDNVTLKYDRTSRMVEWQFTLWSVTHHCRPLLLTQDSDMFANTSCEALKWNILTCQDPESSHSVSYECSKTDYTYILKRCIPAFPPITLTPSVSPKTSPTSHSVIWNVLAQWGNGSYTYSWSWTDNLTWAASSVTKSYTTSGAKTATVTVTSGDQSRTINLAATIPARLSVNLFTQPRSLQTRRAIRHTATVTGWVPPYTYTWSWTDKLKGNTTSILKTYSTPGSKRVIVNVKSSDGQTFTKTVNITVSQR